MIIDTLGVFSTAAQEALGGYTVAEINAGHNKVVDLGFGTNGKGNVSGGLCIRFGVGEGGSTKTGGTALAGGTSVAYTITTGPTSTGTDTTSEVFTLTLAQLNAGYSYQLPLSAARYCKVVGAAATGTFTGNGNLKIWVAPSDFAPSVMGY